MKIPKNILSLIRKKISIHNYSPIYLGQTHQNTFKSSSDYLDGTSTINNQISFDLDENIKNSYKPSLMLQHSTAIDKTPVEVDKQKSYRPSNYNPGLKPSIIESVFGISRHTLRKWENEKNRGKAPLLCPTTTENPRNILKPLRHYTVEDMYRICEYLRSTGQLEKKLQQPITIGVWNNKGGVGKTTLVQQLASIYSILMGYKVLVVDTDSQSDCTLLMNCVQDFQDLADEEPMQPTIRSVIGYEEVDLQTGDSRKYQSALESSIIPLSPTLSVLPADEDVSDLDYDLRLFENIHFNEQGHDVSTLANVEAMVKKCQEKYDFDMIIFDCAPNKSLLNLNILYALDYLVLPVAIEAKCIHSIRRVINFLEKIKSGLGDKFNFQKIIAVPNQYHSNQIIKQKALVKLQELFGSSILSKVRIPASSVIDQATQELEPIFMRAFDANKNRSTPMSKRVSNALWVLAHEIIGQEPQRLLFPEALADEA